MSLVQEATGSATWYVTNGDAIVGPIATDLLVRGVATARIPQRCLVAQPSWTTWRELREVRELAAPRRTPAWAEVDQELVDSGISEDLVKRAPDAGEALLYAMHAAVRATRATGALVHRAREPFIGLVTSSAHGAGVDEQLGEVIAHHDAAYERAIERSLISGRPQDDAATRTIARRFSMCAGAVVGVAMVPVFDGERLLAMLELARVDHPFRAGDADVLARIAEVVCAR